MTVLAAVLTGPPLATCSTKENTASPFGATLGADRFALGLGQPNHPNAPHLWHEHDDARHYIDPNGWAEHVASCESCSSFVGPNRSPRKAETVNDERCDRDRVTAIREIAEPLNDLEIVWMADRLLEALDTIDKARELHYDDSGDCHECDLPAPCLTVRLLALNGGNESGDEISCNDNPADSLRRELGAAVVATQRRIGTTDLTWQLTRDELVPDLVRVVSAALEAARAEGTDETVEILLPLVGYLCDNHADRYGGNHCIDVALDLLRESDSRVEAARADGEKQGRNNAARDIEAHRAKWAPMDGNMDQRRLSRHLGIAARVAQGPIDTEDVRVAFERAVSP